MLRPGIYRVETINIGAAINQVVYGLEEMLAGAIYISALAKFVRTSGGSSADARLQTSLDRGATWMDIIHFGFTATSESKARSIFAKSNTTDVAITDGTLTGNAVKEILGDRFRWKVNTSGTYVGTTLDLSFVVA